MVYGKLVDGSLVYFKPYKGGIHYEDKVIFTKDESVYNQCGWYRIENIQNDGADYIEDNVLYHYVGLPQESDGGL